MVLPGASLALRQRAVNDLPVGEIQLMWMSHCRCQAFG
jgi:hypothetical protein